MYELIRAGAQSYYIESPAKIGLYLRNDTDVCLIDSGNDKDAGRKVRQILDANGWCLTSILNTHSNADHIGGNRYLQQQTGCLIFASGIEAAFTRWPELEPAFLYGGYPGKDLRHKFLMAQESEVLDMTDPRFPPELSIIPLPGHFFHMVGFRTPDNVVYLADCLSSAATLEKYQIGFIYDVAAYLHTLDQVEQMQATLFVPAHAQATADIRPLVHLNREKVWEIGETLTALCAEPICFESLLQRIFTHYALTMDLAQYVLVGSTVRSYLSWLKDRGQLSFTFQDGRMLWQRA